MDKYTVDLDQVLNDFEYSELTDQHSKSVPERTQSNVPFQPPPVIKHSINNVFHSLNEYLNSGINDGSAASTFKEGSYLSEKPESLSTSNNKLTGQKEELCNNNSNHFIGGLENQSLTLRQNEEFKIKEEININSEPEKHLGEVHLPVKNQVEVTNLLATEVSEGLQQVTPNLVEYSNEEAACLLNEASVETPQSLPEQISVPSDNSESNNVDSIKTEPPNIPTAEVGEMEKETVPELNCQESFIENESTNVNSDPECDRSVLDKADSVLDKDEGSSEPYFEVNDCLESAGEKEKANSTEIIEEKDGSGKDITDILVNIGEVESVNTHASTHTNLEGFVIEMSDSPYAVADIKVDKQEKEEKVANEDKEQFNVGETHSSKDITEETPVKEIQVTKNESLYLETNCTSLPEVGNVLPVEVVGTKDHIEEKESPPKIIGFSADVDIDERELNKMLEELESEEEDSHSKDLAAEEDISVDIAEHLETNAEKINIEDKEVEREECNSSIEAAASQTQEGNTEKTQMISSNIKPDTTDLQTKDSPGVSEEKAESPKKYIHPQVIECLEMKRPTRNKKSAKHEPHIEQSNESVVTIQQTQEILEEQSVNFEQEVKNEELSPEKEQESVSRPQNLPLNNELKDENFGRKINLIGSPGSTPYNNVYINKSIEPKTTQDTESDYTSSASPTFSDCSTESTSTASTVSVENVPNNADKFTKKKSGVKNTNVESSELSRAQNAVGGDEEEGEPDADSEDQANQSSEQGAGIAEEDATNIREETGGTISESGSGDSQVQGSQSTDTFLDKSWLGKEAPLWIPDGDAAACLHCDMKFTVLKRRHHCRACGLVLCSKCCSLRFKLEYLETEARVCNKCYTILNKDIPNNAGADHNSSESGDSPAFRPNPNNPLEYCSTVSPLQQAGQAGAPPPSVMVPVGVLKRKGSNKKSNKSVMFCDGIAPGSDLTHLDQDFNYSSDSRTHKVLNKSPEEVKKKEEPTPAPPPVVAPTAKVSRNQPKIDQETGCFIPKSETSLPPTISVNKTDILYSDCSNTPSVVEMLKNEALVFAINQNLFVHVRVINMNCCITKHAWSFCSEGLINVGSDEVVYLIEYIDEESFVPKDVFFHIQNVYVDAVKGTSIKELGLSLHNTSNFLDSRNHAGFVYIKPSFQCLENVIVPKEPYLIGILIHRWETPWAKLFPLRLILRLGAEYRYYPSPLISARHRDSVFVEIGHTIINLLADFRNFTYTLPQIRGLIIHMEEKKTTITIPKNRYDQVMKSISNSSDHILAFAGNFSPNADSHLVCIQDTQGHENCYTTHAINIHNKPRKITGASFIVFNGSLKSSSGMTAKSNIVEDGLMIQIPSEHMDKIRENLRNMKNHTIPCGYINAAFDESVNIVWGENDVDFNVGITSPVDLADMRGVPSIRVHNGKDYFCNNGTRLIRWTEVFILQNGEENPKNQDPVDISKVSESIAKASCTALVKYLDLLVSNSCQKIGIRTTLHVENVSYSAGSNGLKLPPIYMRSLDNELVPVLHRITSNNLGDNAIVLELIFRILNA